MIEYQKTDAGNLSVYLIEDGGTETHLGTAYAERGFAYDANGIPTDPNVRETAASWVVDEIASSGELTTKAATALVDLAALNIQEGQK